MISVEMNHEVDVFSTKLINLCSLYYILFILTLRNDLNIHA